MAEGIEPGERALLAGFIQGTDRLTMGAKVRKFEEAWSRWQGCRHSVLVNSGSSANLILIAAVRELYGAGGVVCQAVTWATNVSPAIQLGMDLHLVDINMENLGPDLDDLARTLRTARVRYVFLTHLLGFCGVTWDLLELCKKAGVTLLEDCCESHGAVYGNRKAGSFGLGSTFSFYYGHHMTTIEGGMVCTDDSRLYETLLLMRSHGLLRELPGAAPVEGLDPRFTFLLHGFNVRPTEINGFLGLAQLPRLDGTIAARNRNLRCWLGALDRSKFYTGFDTRGVSSFALPVVATRQNAASVEDLKKLLTNLGVENRPFVSGNIARQPFLRGLRTARAFPNADYIHDYGMYVGNYPGIEERLVTELADALNEFCA